jgi:pimeloyl-ACP methyl ester carboxylesterase
VQPQVLATGAEMRVTGVGDVAVVCVNGGRAEPVPGTWSSSLEWLVRGLAPRLPGFCFAEVRYRIKSWHRFDDCEADTRAAIASLGARRTVLLGFSMGGAVAIRCADDSSVEDVVGLAPWIPDQLDVEPLRGKRLRVIHGSLDRSLPGVPGVAPSLSRRGFQRALAAGATGDYTLIRGAAHAIALRAFSGTPVPLPRARTWLRLTEAALRAASGTPGGSGSGCGPAPPPPGAAAP